MCRWLIRGKTEILVIKELVRKNSLRGTPHEMLIAQIYHVSVDVLSIHLGFMHKKSEIFISSASLKIDFHLPAPMER